MQSQNISKLHSTTHKQKIFNVRKRAYKHFDNQKYLKYNCSPILRKEPFQSIQNVINNKKMEYHYQLAIMSSPKYKELEQKYQQLKQKNRQQKEIKLNIIREKEQQLKRYIYERQKLIDERQKLDQKRHQIKQYINQMRQQRQVYHLQNVQRNQIYQNITAEQLQNTIMALQYQGGIDIDTDNMTYQQLLQLEEKMGKVSKGLTQEQYKLLLIMSAEKKHQAQVCSICYEGIKEKEEIHELRCKHMYHCQCIKQWFSNEKTCPLCKQEVFESQIK